MNTQNRACLSIRSFFNQIDNISHQIGVHHIEIWVGDLDRARTSWGWLFVALGRSVDQKGNSGISWRGGDVYIVVTRPPALSDDEPDRRRPGINRIALHGGTSADVDRIVGRASTLEDEVGSTVDVVATVPR